VSAAERKIEAAELGIELRPLFPTLQRRINGHPLTYLDSAATSLRPEQVIDAEADFYRHHNANVHRGVHSLVGEATDAYEASRDRLAQLLGAPRAEQIIFTRGATSALNGVARGVEHSLRPGDEILLTEMEHHANLVPWIMLSERRDVRLRHIPITESGELDLTRLKDLITPRTRVVSLTLVSNVLGTINPVAEVAAAAHRVGAMVVVDAAQAFGHLPLRLDALDADLMAFSAHKAYGPMGVGVLAGTAEALEALMPWEGGGEMIREVRLESASYAELPDRLEAGTPNVAGVVATAPALDLLERVGLDRVRAHEQHVTGYALQALEALGGLHIFGPRDPARRGGLVSFEDPAIHPHDLASLVDQRGVALRAGHHCAQPLHRRLGVVASARVSFGLYSTTDDVDALIDALRFARRYFA